MTSIRYATALLCFVSATLALAAQTPRSATVRLIPGLQVDILTRYTASFWIVAETSVRDYGEATLARGFSIGLDAGTGGGKILLGWANQGGIGGGSIAVGLLRSWNRPYKLKPHQTFVGPEIRGYLSALGYGAGYYWRVSRPGLGPAHAIDLSLALWFRL